MNCVGIGKTTMAHELCSRWAKDGFLAEDFDAVILIPLRSLQQRSLKHVIIKQIGEENYQLLEKSAGRRCLIILEGLDEMSVNHQKNDPFLTSLVKECNELQEARIIITARPHACEDIAAGRRVEVVGFGNNEIREFVEHSFPNDIQSSEDFLRQLDEYPQLHSLCYIPLNLVILVDVFNCSQKKLPSTLTELYQVFIVMTMKRQVKKEKKPVSSTVTVAAADHVEKMLRGIPKETVGIVLCLCRLAYRGFFDWYCCIKDEDGSGIEWKDPKIIFTESDLTQCDIKVTSNFDGFGLLKVTETHQLFTDINTYNFNHLTIQEFLCAVHISLVLLQQEQLCLLRKHFHDYPNVFTFVCGLTGLASSKMFHFICTKLTLYGPNHNVITAMRCINESKQSSTAHQLVSPLALDMSGYSLLPYDCLCVSNILSCYPVIELDIEGCNIGNKEAEMFMKHYTNKTITCQLLEKLNLSDNELTSEGMEHMMNFVKTSKPHY